MILRYPGGKARFRPAIMKLAPQHYGEYREPFVGGGGIFFSIPQRIRRWINDKDSALIEVYKALRDRPAQFIEACRQIRPLADGEGPGRLKALFHQFVAEEAIDPAVRYYFLNRTSWGGIPHRLHRSPTFSTPGKWSVIMTERLWEAAGVLQGVTITAGDYLPLLQTGGTDVWIYCDPPYFVNNVLPKGSQLYEKNLTHEQHATFAAQVKSCPHKVLISYDDHPFIRDLYADPVFHVFVTDRFRYPLHGKRVQELLITNYRATPSDG
jgi:DNA adenine methylase